MLWKETRRQIFLGICSGILQFLMISIYPEKMVPVLNHIAENEGIQDILYGAHVKIFHNLTKRSYVRNH